MTTEELAELFLAHLYQLSEEAPHPNFLFSVNDFAPKLGLTDREELQRAIDYLGDRGLIMVASFDPLGGISAGITIEGSVFVEKGGETGVIEQYRKSPLAFEKKSSEPPAPSAGEEDVLEERSRPLFTGRRATEAILNDIEEILKIDGTVTAEFKEDLLSDLATVRIQIGRNVKDRRIIEAALGNLSGTLSIAPLVTALTSVLDAYSALTEGVDGTSKK